MSRRRVFAEVGRMLADAQQQAGGLRWSERRAVGQVVAAIDHETEVVVHVSVRRRRRLGVVAS